MNFVESVLATTTANICSYLLYQGVINTGWFKSIRNQLTEFLGKLNPRAEKKYGDS